MAAQPPKKEGVVFEWLSRIGLSHAVASFQAMGLTTPQQLINLRLEQFDSFGVTAEDDKKRLLELVNRVKEVSSMCRAKRSARK